MSRHSCCRRQNFDRVLMYFNHLGIDLGTTNSAVAIMEGQTAKIIENSEGMQGMQSSTVPPN